MQYVVTLIIFLMANTVSYADDAETNPLAKKIKSKLQTAVNKKFDDYQGYCDVMIEMEHKGKQASIKRIRGSGDHAVCKYVKSKLKVGKRYRYTFPEIYIRLHITTGD
ncbi:hypothetical protein [Vibrio alfacsensis]|uniref:hypothetical protein n=1 Tax=Vibrio alfacsensis TaxID=1074311 RepID=UPI004067E841